MSAENWRRTLERERDEARAENRELRRKVAVHEAGLTGLNDQQLVGLFAVVDGDVTAEALNAAASELYAGRLVGRDGVEPDGEG